MTRLDGIRFGSGALRAALAVIVVGTAALAPAVGAATLPTRQGSGALAIEILRITPSVPTPTATLTVSGVIRNAGPTRLGRVEVRLEVGTSPLTLRSQLTPVEAGVLPTQTQAVDGGLAVLEGGIDPDDFTPFRLSVPVSALGLPTTEAGRGVYELDLTASAPDGSVPDRTVITFLPWLPDPAAIAPTRLAWLWPLADRPVRDSAGIFSNDRLAESLAVGGRLRTLVDAAAGRPVTWVVDPNLLEAAEQMSDGYQVRARGGGTKAGTGRTAATDWLDRLRTAIDNREVVNLPYADVDVTALNRNGLADDIQTAISHGAEVARSVLGRDTVVDTAWPPGDLTDRATMTTIREAGQHAIILADTALPPVVDPSYTPDGRGRLTTGAGPLEPLLIDTALSDVLRSGSGRRPGVGPLMIQRFLAETELITLQRPNAPRSLVVAAPRYWSVDPQTATQLLQTATTTPWLTSVPLSAVRAVEPPELPRVVAEYPDSARAAELPADYLAGVRRSRTELLRFTEILAGPGPTAQAYTAARLRTESGSWRRADGRPGVTAAGRSFARRIDNNLEALRSQVSIVGGGTVTLSSHSGTIPVTVRNDLPQPVSIEVYAESTREDRLQVEQPEPVVVPAGGVAPVSVRAEAVANGLVEVRVRLRNDSGQAISDWQSIRVQVTNYGTLGSVIIAGATVLLFLSATVRIVRRGLAGRRRRSTRPASGPAESVEAERVEV